jgi:hypothetical protein
MKIKKTIIFRFLIVISILFCFLYYSNLKFDFTLNLTYDEVKHPVCDTFQIKIPPSNELNNKKQFNQDKIDSLQKDAGKVISSYLSLDLEDKYASHAVPLTLMAFITDGDILELGMGKYSTVILNKIAKEQSRFLLSTESEFEWMQTFTSLNDTYNHLIVSSKSMCAKTIDKEKFWGLVFVDHLNAGTRRLDIIHYANRSLVVICHDSEKRFDKRFYKLEKAYPFFKYHCKYSLFFKDGTYKSTSLLSNYVDFSKIKHILHGIETKLKHETCNQNL